MENGPEKQEIETDVVIVGYGGAGATAAITAHDNGVNVVILEKMTEGGGNTRVSAGVLINPKSIDSVGYIEALCFGTTEHEIVETYVENAIQNE
jgi:flavin-dependent dehydrogenase